MILNNVDIDQLSIDRLEELDRIVTNRIFQLKNVLPRKEIIEHFNNYGYIVPKNAKFWKVVAPVKGYGGYGMEVGQYEHSCHVDSIDFKVLLVVNGNEQFTDSYSDLWLKGPF